MRLPCYDVSKATIIDQIKRDYSPLKIVIKHKNENIQLQHFLEHHLSFLGPKSIIVADNGTDASAASHVLSNAISDGHIVFSFNGHCDDLHYPHRYPDLYQALQASSGFYVFLDADEKLFQLALMGAS